MGIKNSCFFFIAKRHSPVSVRWALLPALPLQCALAESATIYNFLTIKKHAQ